MPTRHTHLTPQSSHGQLAKALAALRAEFEVPEQFPPEVLTEAEEAARTDTGTDTGDIRDLRDIEFVTLDPIGSRDLDQAFHLERSHSGWLVRYAIADVPSFVRPGGAIDLEARGRGETLYLPDGSVPLHPEILSEGRVSLLPEQDRTAFVWSVRLDVEGNVADATVERARVRSRAQLDYPSAQEAIDAGQAQGALALLPEVGRLRIAQEQARGGASLNMPDEEIIRDDSGYQIVRRFSLPVEKWNAQLSLLTGIVAGEMMLAGGIGVLRTMPPPDSSALREFRDRVEALGQPWLNDQSYGEYLRELDPTAASAPAVLQAAAALFRGAGYETFDGETPDQPMQAAIAAPYAHVTAPLRRLVDRWGLVICEALCTGREVPSWVRESLAELPDLMRTSGSRAGQISAAALDRVEAALLRDRVGEVFDAVVVDVRNSHARVQLTDPAITAQCSLGEATPTSNAEPRKAESPSAAPANMTPPSVEQKLTAGTIARVRVQAVDVLTGEIELVPAKP